jgi:hypothetical protein
MSKRITRQQLAKVVELLAINRHKSPPKIRADR